MQSNALVMEEELANTYAMLQKLGLDQHARDFWRIRASKQIQQVQENSLLHEHTALNQYIKWHAEDGSRLPSFMRGTERAIAGIVKLK